MCGKIKPDLSERGLDIPRQKRNRLMCFFCYSQIILVDVSLDNKEKYGDKINGFSNRMQGMNKI
jgi:hypothetical protein